MKISIVIPIYNARDYIEECLKSIISQSYKGDIECLLIDDCGNDGTISIAQNFIDNYNGNIKFIILHHRNNKGAGAARNTGLKAASGDYILFIDSDDYITDTCLEEMSNILKKHPNVDLIQAGIKTTDGSIPWFDFEKNPFPEYTDDFHDIKTRLLGREIIPASPCSKLIPVKFLKQNKIFFHEGIVIEDVLWCNILAKYVKSIACLNKNTYIYRIHDNSVVTSGLGVDPKRKLIVYDLMIDKIDAPYVKEQVTHLTNQLEKIYFEYESLEIRKTIGKLLNKLSFYCHNKEKIRLKAKAICAKYDTGNHSIAYYFFYLITTHQSLFRIIQSLIKRLCHI